MTFARRFDAQPHRRPMVKGRVGLKPRPEKYPTIQSYNDAQGEVERAICNALRREIDGGLRDAESKIWHAHPVWFLDGNPIVGYGKQKDCIRLMFWSGQSFEASELHSVGSFKAAVFRYTDKSQVDPSALKRWLGASRRIQWDYKNIVKRRGKLLRLG